jgi:hypothetical protein
MYVETLIRVTVEATSEEDAIKFEVVETLF